MILAGCAGGDAGGHGVSDAGVVETRHEIEIGTGEDAFHPITQDSPVDLTQGAQGGGPFLGFHIWSAARVKDFNPEGATITFGLRDEAGAQQAVQTRRVTLQPNGRYFDVFGIAARITDCCAVASRPATMTVRITDADGKTGSARRSVMVGRCVDTETGRSLCP